MSAGGVFMLKEGMMAYPRTSTLNDLLFFILMMFPNLSLFF
jgi:hypothetical protein